MRKLLLLLLTAGLLVMQAHAQDKVGITAANFLGIGVGARGMAMGSAQVASAEGPTALYWNPSAVTAMQTSGITFTHTDWFDDATIEHVGLVLDTRAGHLGLSITALDYGEIQVRTIDLPEGTGEHFSPLSLAVGLTYARDLTDRFAIGATGKFIRETIWNETANGAALDIGVLYNTGFRNLRIGMALANFGSSMQLSGKDLRRAIDIDEEIEGNNPRNAANLEVDSWALPLMFRVGLAADAFSGGGQRLTLSVDGLAPADNAQSANFGAEYSFRELLFIRGGYRQVFVQVAEDGGPTFGAGLRYALDQRFAGMIDYTFVEYSDFGYQHMFSLGVTF